MEPVDEKIIRQALKEINLLKVYLASSEATTKCIERLKKMHEVSDSIIGKFGWLRNLYCDLFKKDDSEVNEFVRPNPNFFDRKRFL